MYFLTIISNFVNANTFHIDNIDSLTDYNNLVEAVQRVVEIYGHFTMGGVDYNVFVYNVEYQFLGTLLPQIHNIYID